MKTLAEYLAAAGGDQDAALKAMHADLAQVSGSVEAEAGANIRARVISKALEPLAKKLGIELPAPGQRPSKDATDALADAVTGSLTALDAQTGTVDRLTRTLGDAGLDTTVLADAEKSKTVIADWLKTLKTHVEGEQAAKQELNIYRYATAENLKPDAVMLQKGLERLESRQITRKNAAGKDETVTVWGIPGEGDAFKPASEHLAPVMDSLRVGKIETGTRWVSGQEQRESGGKDAIDRAIEARQANANKAVDPFSPTPSTSTTI